MRQLKEKRPAWLKAVVVAAVAVSVSHAGAAFEARQVFREERFMCGNVNLRVLQPIDEAAWLGPKGGAKGPYPFVRFRRRFKGRAAPLMIDVSADARFVLFLDGQEIARGPHQGFPDHWYHGTYSISGLADADHVMEAVVFDLGDKGPFSILTSGQLGFILKAADDYDADLTTGRAAWQVADVDGMSFGGVTDPDTMTGAENIVQGTGFLDPAAATNWRETVVLKKPVKDSEYGFAAKGWALFPTERPDQLHEEKAPGYIRVVLASTETKKPVVYRAKASDADWKMKFEALLRTGMPVEIPPGASLRVLWDLDDYFCAYPLLETSGGKGAEIRWAWAESLYDPEPQGHIYVGKGHRDSFDGKAMVRSMYDTFLPDGRQQARFTVPWWKAGRWIELALRTESEPLVLRRLAIAESRYPLECAARFDCDDPMIKKICGICVRGMQNCLHETFVDCPYFEQQMYPGDTRVEMLVLNAMNGDARPIRHGIGIFDHARRNNGLVPMNFPSRNIQDSATYSLCWVMMAGDYVLWHGADRFLRARIPGIRHTLGTVALYANKDGLLENLPGWSFMDWVPDWDTYGNAPDGRMGLSALNNLLYVHALQAAARVEHAVGDKALAGCCRTRAKTVGEAIRAHFWDASRGLVADTVQKNRFSEHAQCLALLADILPPDDRARALAGLVEAKDLARCTVYFSHYLFETYLKFGRADLFLKKLDLWRGFVRDGLRTPLEAPGVRARSDCHAWGSHPVYHLLTGVAGIRPALDGFSSVIVEPHPGGLKWIRASMPTPKGAVSIDLRFDGDRPTGSVILPEGLPGEFRWKGIPLKLKDGHL